jgi:hypothetical protein
VGDRTGSLGIARLSSVACCRVRVGQRRKVVAAAALRNRSGMNWRRGGFLLPMRRKRRRSRCSIHHPGPARNSGKATQPMIAWKGGLPVHGRLEVCFGGLVGYVSRAVAGVPKVSMLRVLRRSRGRILLSYAMFNSSWIRRRPGRGSCNEEQFPPRPACTVVISNARGRNWRSSGESLRSIRWSLLNISMKRSRVRGLVGSEWSGLVSRRNREVASVEN